MRAKIVVENLKISRSGDVTLMRNRLKLKYIEIFCQNDPSTGWLQIKYHTKFCQSQRSD